MHMSTKVHSRLDRRSVSLNHLLEVDAPEHPDDGERLLLAADVGFRLQYLGEGPVPLARKVGAEDLIGHGVPVLDVGQVLGGDAGTGVPSVVEGLFDGPHPLGLAHHNLHRRQRPLDRLHVGPGAVGGEHADGLQHGLPPQRHARQVRKAADEVAVAAAEWERRGRGEEMLKARKGVPMAAAIGEAGEGEVVSLHGDGGLVIRAAAD
uniref:Uncharacterized protein n=1 Tax=Triticum urartu TaxID=4572 RepID=A0A8R7QLL8_TRIUA